MIRACSVYVLIKHAVHVLGGRDRAEVGTFSIF